MGFRRRAKREDTKAAKQRIVRGLSPAQLEALPAMSDTLVMFAGQFLIVPPGENRKKMLANILKVVTVAWNMPVAEQNDPEAAAVFRKTYETLVKGMPEVAKSAVDRLLDRRVTHFSHDPRTVVAEIEDRDGDYYIKASSEIRPAKIPRNAPGKP